MLSWAEWLESTGAGVLVRESLWGFQIAVALHLVSLMFSVGILMWFDLRLLGVAMRRCPVSVVYRRLLPWFAGGFVLMFGSGLLLLAGFATAAYGNTFFRLKLVVIGLAGLNALAYHALTARGAPSWDGDARPPLRVRAAGLVSISLWATTILAGRMMSYTMF